MKDIVPPTHCSSITSQHENPPADPFQISHLYNHIIYILGMPFSNKCVVALSAGINVLTLSQAMTSW